MLVQIADIEGVEESQRPGYQDGLRNVIIGLKEKKVQGFEEVAKAILEYRRAFAEGLKREEMEKKETERKRRIGEKGCSMEEGEEEEEERKGRDEVMGGA